MGLSSGPGWGDSSLRPLLSLECPSPVASPHLPLPGAQGSKSVRASRRYRPLRPRCPQSLPAQEQDTGSLGGTCLPWLLRWRLPAQEARGEDVQAL